MLRKMKRCEEEGEMNMRLRRRMKQTLDDMVGVWKRKARNRLFSMLEYELIVRETSAENGTKLWRGAGKLNG